MNPNAEPERSMKKKRRYAMNNTIAAKPFNRRAFVSLTLLLSGLLLPFSGYMNHLLAFRPLTEERHFWMAVHNSAGILFMLCAITHITGNRHSIARYAKKMQSALVSKEAMFAAMLVLGVVGFFAAHVFLVN
jgi:uncharacterized iron-regulated membrane protein